MKMAKNEEIINGNKIVTRHSETRGAWRLSWRVAYASKRRRGAGAGISESARRQRKTTSKQQRRGRKKMAWRQIGIGVANGNNQKIAVCS